MILVSGSLAYDSIMDFPGKFQDHILPEKLHVLSVSFLINKIEKNFGGTAGNIAYTLALLGERPTIFASAGNDFTPYKAWLTRHKVDCSKISIQSVPTASAYVMTDRSDNQITAFYPGAMGRECKMKNEECRMLLKNAKMAIVSPGNIDDMRVFPTLYKKHKIPYIYDPGQGIPALSRNDLINGMNGAEVLMLNDYELALVQEKTGFTKEKILNRVKILVVTLGEKGSIIQTKDSRLKIQEIKIPIVKPKAVVDPTGAGDAYRAGFIYGLVQGWPLEKIGKFGALLAAYTVEKTGTQTHQFSWKTLKARYHKNFKEKLSG